MRQHDPDLPILTELSRLRARWLAELTRAVDFHMRSRPFLVWMRYSVMAMTEAQSVVTRGYLSLFFRVRRSEQDARQRARDHPAPRRPLTRRSAAFIAQR